MDYFAEALAAAIQLVLSFDIEIYSIVWTSIYITISATLIGAISCIPLGFFIAFNEFRGKGLLLHILNTLMALPTVLVGLLLYGFLTRNGPMGELGLLYTPVAMIIGQWILIAPILVNLTITAIQTADTRLFSTCQSLGANKLQLGLLFMKELRFGLIAAIVMAFGRAIGEVGVAMMLGGNIEGYTRTMTTAIALETSKGEFEFALALGLVLLAVAFLVNGFMLKLRHMTE